jgi:hypothetical protein
MSKRAVEIDESLYQLGETKASAEHKTLDQVVEALLRSWLGGEPEDQETITCAPRSMSCVPAIRWPRLLSACMALPSNTP